MGKCGCFKKKYAGHPFWNENIWHKGSINYKGVRYDDLAIRYDIYSNDIIVFKKTEKEGRAFKLNKEQVSNFSMVYPETNDSMYFQVRKDVANDGGNILGVAYKGKTSYFIAYKKEINNVVSDKYTGEYLAQNRLFAKMDLELIEFESKSDLLKLFASKQNDVKKFMRKNRIKFQKKTPENLIPVFKYFDSINKSYSGN